MKKNIIIIILSALVIGLVGYFVYDNFLKKDVVNELSTKKKVDNNEIDKENDYSDTNDDTEYAFSVEELSELKKTESIFHLEKVIKQLMFILILSIMVP